jgi:hypothetical protein
MPKQVRLRRGTTVQHSTFTGAQGEVTFDTDKKCLVIHDGVTPAGIPFDLAKLIRVTLGDPFLQQEIESSLYISGGGEENTGLYVEWGAYFLHEVTVNEQLQAGRFAISQDPLVYASSINLNLATGYSGKRLTLGGNLTLTASGHGYGRYILMRIVCDGSLRTLTFPAGWKFVGSAVPANIAANKTGLLELWCFGTTDSDVVAKWLVEL